MNPRYPQVSERARHRCEYCRAPEAIFNFPFEVEHIIPLSQGGVDNEANLALSCRSCNIHKSNHIMAIDDTTQSEVFIFNPRQDGWEDHFQLEAETGLVLGLTPTGRASAMRLQMNSAAQVAARLKWIQLGLLP